MLWFSNSHDIDYELEFKKYYHAINTISKTLDQNSINKSKETCNIF